MLASLPKNGPFVFFDTDTLLTDNLLDVPFDFDRPSASLRRENTWPKPPLYGPGYSGIWKSLYDKFGLDFDTSLDLSEPDEYWKRYLYFNAGFFYYNSRMLSERSSLNTHWLCATKKCQNLPAKNCRRGWIR